MTFVDSILQAWLLLDDSRNLFIPTEIKKLTINKTQHNNYLQSLDGNAERGRFQAFFFRDGREYIDFISFKSSEM